MSHMDHHILLPHQELDPERLLVVKDASFLDGRAGLAVTGDLGAHSRVVVAEDSTHAEEMALLWAMQLAVEEQAFAVDFVSDHNPMTRLAPISALLAEYPDWRLIAVPRRYVWTADRLAHYVLRYGIAV